jgi:Electron transfer DM13
MNRERLIPAVVLASILGIGLLVLQRWVAETRDVAIALVGVWFALVGVAVLVLSSRRAELRLPLLGTFAAVLLGTVAIGYFTGFRDTQVDEDVVVASERVPDTDRDAALAAAPPSDATDAKADKPEPDKPSGPVELSQGDFVGVDGHSAAGVATVVRDPEGNRSLTFTGFNVDPGPGVVVWLTQSGDDLDDRIELGGLKGNVGDQEYAVPDDADLRKYDTVVLYCTPFTVRIAVAPLS